MNKCHYCKGPIVDEFRVDRLRMTFCQWDCYVDYKANNQDDMVKDGFDDLFDLRVQEI